MFEFSADKRGNKDLQYIFHSEDPRMQAYATRRKISMAKGWYFMDFDLMYRGPFDSFERALGAFQKYADEV